MQLHDQIAALVRGEPLPRGEAMADALAPWRAGRAGRVLADLDRMNAGAEAADCPDLMALFAPGGETGRGFVVDLISAIAGGFAAQPLSRLPLGNTATPGLGVLFFGRIGGAVLAISVFDGAHWRGDAPGHITAFQPTTIDEVVIAGTGCGTLVSIVGEDGPGAVTLARRAVTLTPGTVITRDNRREELVLHRFAGQMVTLRLQRTSPGDGLVRDIDLDTGRVVHLSSADPGESRRQLMIALLGHMGRTTSAPVLAGLAGRVSASPGLRWQALRECLGLDTAAGFAALCAMAGDAADPLAGAAGALRAQLVEDHPVLEAIVCPA